MPKKENLDQKKVSEIKEKYLAADERRIEACLKACEGIKTEALERGFVRDILMQYYELCDLHELQNLLTCCTGSLYSAVLKDVSDLWDDINAGDLKEDLKEESEK